jgi:hypothetical protein
MFMMDIQTRSIRGTVVWHGDTFYNEVRHFHKSVSSILAFKLSSQEVAECTTVPNRMLNKVRRSLSLP